MFLGKQVLSPCRNGAVNSRESGMRTGAELLQATKPFAVEDRSRSWRYLASTLAVIAGCWAVVLATDVLVVELAAAVLAGLTQVRLFILYHDYMHGAILHKSRPAELIMNAVGYFMLTVRSVWKETHNFHHKNNAKLIGSSIGSFPVLTVGMWRGLNETQRRQYRLLRHPVVIFGGYLPVFLIGMTIAPFRRNRKKHWQGLAALALHLVAIAALAGLAGWSDALCLLILPLAITHGMGAYLFYAQHNFPDMALKGRREWDYTHAALRSSSMFDMSPLMHWFTGNIGYHHVHHLNHRIPFYRLPEAMAAIPELQSPGRTSWRLQDVKACLDLAVWDPEQNRMLTYSELGTVARPAVQA